MNYPRGPRPSMYDLSGSDYLPLDLTPTIANYEAGTPEWWLHRLMTKLDLRAGKLGQWEAYYDGLHPLNFFDDKVRQVFGQRFNRFASNFVAMVVDAFSERIQVNGIAFRDDQGDSDLWAIWQDNDLDGGSAMAHTEALIKGASYTLIEPRDNDTPVITVEDALDTIVETDPRHRRKRLAALKRWIDGDGFLVAYVYLPDAVFKFRSKTKYSNLTGAKIEFDPLLVNGESWPLRNAMGVVPIVPLLNRPRPRDVYGRSEIEAIASNQDLINYYRVMAVIAARYTAYPQRWVKNLPIALDPVTGLPAQPFKGGMADLWQIEPFDADDPRSLNAAAQPEFGQFAAGSVDPYIRLIEHEVASMAAIAGVPYYYVLSEPTSVPPSGESLKSSEARLVRKVGTIETFLSEGWEETMRVALRAMNDERADLRTAETRWDNIETMNDAVVVDGTVKLSGLLDDTTRLERLGYTPEAIRRIEKRKADQKRIDDAAAAANPPTPMMPQQGNVVIPAPIGPRMSPTTPTR